MNDRQVNYLREAGKVKSLNKAAHNLNLAVPSLSNAIKALENELGLQLLVRSKIGVELTPIGAVLVESYTQFEETFALAKETYLAQKEQKLKIAN